MHLLRKRACQIIPWLLILLVFGSARSAEIFLVKEKQRTKIVITSPERLKYQFKEPQPGLSVLILKNLAVKRKRKIPIKDRIIKDIEVRSRGRDTVLSIRLDKAYHLKLEETYPPFKLTLTPERLTSIHLMKKMLLSIYQKGECNLYLANAARLNLSALPPQEREKFMDMEYNCTLKADNPVVVLTSIERLMPLLKGERKKILWAKKVEILLKQKRYDEALAEGKLFIQKYKDYTADLVASYMAEALIRLERKNDAILLLKAMLKAHPDSPYLAHMYKELAKAYYLKDNFVGTFFLFDKAYQRDRTLMESDGEALFMYGSSSYRIGLKEKAKRILLRTLNLHPNTVEAAKSLGLLGNIYAEKGNWKVAEWFYRLCMRLYPHTRAAAVARIKLAEHYEEIKRYRDALNLYTEVEILYPNMSDVLEVALYRKGIMLLRLGRYEDAIQAFKDFMLKVPQSKFIQEAEKYIEEAEFKIAERKYKENRLEDALKLLTRFATRYPNNPHTPKAIEMAGKALIRIIEDRYSRKDCGGIMVFWDLYRNFLPRKAKQGLVLFHIAQCMLKQNRTKEAIDTMNWIKQNIGKAFPERKKLLKYLADYYFGIEDYDRAAEVAEELVSLSKAPEFPRIHMLLFRLYFAAGLYDKMFKLADKMEREKIGEKDLEYIQFLEALVLLDRGDEAEGVKKLEKFMTMKGSLLHHPDRFGYAKILLARMAYNRNNPKKAYDYYLWYANTFPNGRYTAESLFMLGLINNGTMKDYFWNTCIQKFPQSHWSKEIRAHRLAKEILHEAKRATGDGSP